MATTRSVIAARLKADLEDSTVAAAANVVAATWASATSPHVFRGFGGFVTGRSRGRLPFIEYDITDQQFTLDNSEGGTVESTIRIAVHAGGRDLATIGNYLDGILMACFAKIRSQAEDNYFMLGNDVGQEVEQGPWGHMLQATFTVQHTYDRTSYEVV